MESTQDMLNNHADALDEMVRSYARQLESGEYGNQWEVQSYDEPVDVNLTVTADDEDDARMNAAKELGIHSDESWEVTHIQADEPTVDETPISEAPYAVTDERGRPFSILLAGGGPTFEVVAEGDDNARLEGYWGSDRAKRHGDHYNVFLNYFIERD